MFDREHANHPLGPPAPLQSTSSPYYTAASGDDGDYIAPTAAIASDSLDYADVPEGGYYAAPSALTLGTAHDADTFLPNAYAVPTTAAAAIAANDYAELPVKTLAMEDGASGYASLVGAHAKYAAGSLRGSSIRLKTEDSEVQSTIMGHDYATLSHATEFQADDDELYGFDAETET